MTSAIADALRLPAGPVDLTAIDPDSAPGFDGKKAEAAGVVDRLAAERSVHGRRMPAVRAGGPQQ